MLIIKCDRCWKEMHPIQSFRIAVQKCDADPTIRYDSYELCKDCKETLECWLTANRRAEAKEDV